MTIQTLDYSDFEANAITLPQWKSYRSRWVYHAKSIEIVRGLNISGPSAVLEIGAFGAGLVLGSNKMDLPGGSWPLPAQHLAIWHDARIIPWPFENGKFELVIAMRVFHHLNPMQRECFMEAKRIARNVLIECPEWETIGEGITRAQFIEWNGGESPIVEHDMGAWGRLYLWKGDVI